jgi:hypothetical protein
MKMNVGSGSASILMRHVRRHARLATLWQPPEAPQPAQREAAWEESARQPLQPSEQEMDLIAPQAGAEDPALPGVAEAIRMAGSPQAPLLARSHSPVIARWPAPQLAAPSAAPQKAQPIEPLARSSPALPPVEPAAPAPVHRQAAQPKASPTEHLSASDAPKGEKQPEKEASAAEQASWLRLQAIMRAHREKQAQGAAASAALDSQAGEAPAGSLVREVAEKPPSAPAVESLLSTEKQKPASATMHRALTDPRRMQIIETVAQRVQADGSLAQPQPEAEPAPVTASHPGEQVAPPERPSAAQPSPVSDQEEHNAPPSAGRSSSEDLGTPGQVAAHLAVAATSSAAGVQPAEPPAHADLVTQAQPNHPSVEAAASMPAGVDGLVDAEGPVELHSMPLEAIWPVQRRVASSDAALRLTRTDDDEPTESDVDTAANGPDEIEEAPRQAGERQTVGESGPAAPDGTQSARTTHAIEQSRAGTAPETEPQLGTLDRPEVDAPVQTAAQPFPAMSLRAESQPSTVAPPLSGEDAQPEAAQPQAAARSGTAVQLQADADLVTPARQSVDEALPPRAQRPAVAQTALSSPQEQVGNKAPPPVSMQPENPPIAIPHMIPTEIGPLPADLWELVDERPPNTPEPRHSAGLGSLSGETFSGWVERRPDSEEDQPALLAGLGEVLRPAIQADGPASEIVQTAHLPLEIEEEEEQPAVESASQPPVGDGKATQPEQADLARLVQQVYAEIRRRLALEWERSRR